MPWGRTLPADIILLAWREPHSGHFGSACPPASTRCSKQLPQLSQWYSKIGIDQNSLHGLVNHFVFQRPDLISPLQGVAKFF
jgi:hypothetical protein